MRGSRTSAAVACAAILIALLGAAPAVAAEPAEATSAPTSPVPADATATPTDPADPDARMGDYSAARFTAQADALPVDVTGAIERDLGVTPEQYLASAAATVDAGQVIDDLKGEGVEVSDSRLEGTHLVVEVPTAADAAAAVDHGADAVVTGHGPARTIHTGKPATALADLLNGTGWGFVNGRTGWLCSVGFNGRAKSSGAAQFVTAGHCLRAAGALTSPLPAPRVLGQTAANSKVVWGAGIGAMIESSFEFGNYYDSGLVSVTNASLTPRPTTTTWGGGTKSPAAGTPVPVYGATTPITGSLMCKSGRTSGWTCGKVLGKDIELSVDQEHGPSQFVNAIASTACALPGDSGGAAMVGNFAIGVLSAGDGPTKAGCGDSYYFPMRSTYYESIAKQHPDWELSVSLSKPVISDASGIVFHGGRLQGSLPHGVSGDKVFLSLDGATQPVSTVTLASGSTDFSLPLGNAGLGKHTYRVIAGQGTWNRSTAATGSFTVATAPSVSRIAAPDRYTEAVAIAKAGHPSGADVVYVASGEVFPDALSAAPAAAAQGGPLLLTGSKALPAAVKTEIVALKPKTIVVVGGTGAVSAGVEKTLRSIAPVTRYAGSDRYAASRSLVEGVFGGSGVKTLYITTGVTFPDALSAGAAAGSSGSAVLLVNGASSALDARTLATIARLHPQAIRIAGGAGSVSSGIEASLAGKAASVARLGGADRWATSQAINADAFSSAAKIYVASGIVFPDALAGAVLAAQNSAPLYVSQTNCLPPGVIASIVRLGTTGVTVLGGTGALTARVQALASCA